MKYFFKVMTKKVKDLTEQEKKDRTKFSLITIAIVAVFFFIMALIPETSEHKKERLAQEAEKLEQQQLKQAQTKAKADKEAAELEVRRGFCNPKYAAMYIDNINSVKNHPLTIGIMANEPLIQTTPVFWYSMPQDVQIRTAAVVDCAVAKQDHGLMWLRVVDLKGNTIEKFDAAQLAQFREMARNYLNSPPKHQSKN